MIIKFFGKQRNSRTIVDDMAQGGGEAGGDADQGKIEFIKLIEPLIQIITRSKEYGTKLTALAVMAVVNMCNYSEDIKDIFLMKNGSQIINDLLDSKDEDILLNNLRLIMTLIT